MELASYSESSTGMMIFSGIMAGLILLTLPLIILSEKGEDRYNKKRGNQSSRRPQKSRSRFSSSSTVIGSEISSFSTSQETLDMPNESNNYVKVKVANKCTQSPDPCQLLYDANKPTTRYAKNKVVVSKESESTLVESSTQLESSTNDIPANKKAPPTECYYVKRLKRRESTLSGRFISSTEETDEGTQTSTYDFDISRDCIIISDDSQCEIKDNVLIGKPSRFIKKKSSTNLVTTRSIIVPIQEGQPETNQAKTKADKMSTPKATTPKQEVEETGKRAKIIKFQPTASNNRIICPGPYPVAACDCCKAKSKKCCNSNNNSFKSGSDMSQLGPVGSKSKFY